VQADLAETVVVLDGGLATHLESRGHDLSDALWSARLLSEDPAEILAAHTDFFLAGARIATTASYQASFEGFATRGEDAAVLLRRSVSLAKRARDRMPDQQRRWVAASVGPYGATLADGSEYRGRYGLAVRRLADFHRRRLDVLAEAAPDVLALETVPDVNEAIALVDAIAGLGIPAWLSYTIAGDRTRAGQPLADAFAVAAGVEDIIAVGVNCCDPDDVAPAVRIAQQVTGKPVIAYPNSGERWDATRRAWVGPSRFAPDLARQWCADGARIVGGCCRVTPSDIAALARSEPGIRARDAGTASQCGSTEPSANPEETQRRPTLYE
jgi:homocysteine S-methyltransferase